MSVRKTPAEAAQSGVRLHYCTDAPDGVDLRPRRMSVAWIRRPGCSPQRRSARAWRWGSGPFASGELARTDRPGCSTHARRSAIQRTGSTPGWRRRPANPSPSLLAHPDDMGRKVTYRRVRVDFWTHDGTGALPRLSKLLFLFLATGGHASCIHEISVRRLRQKLDAQATMPEVEAAVADLVARGIARWDADREIVWLIEGLDEQGFTGPKNEASTRKHLESFPQCEVTRHFAVRYPQVVPDSWDRVSAYGIPPLESDQTRFRPAPSTATAPATATAPRKVEAATTDPSWPSSGVLHEVDMVRRKVEGETGKKIGGLTRRIEKLDGLAPAVEECGLREVLAVVEHRCRAVAAGDVPEQLWRRMFTGDGFHAAREQWRKDTDRKASEDLKASEEADRRAKEEAGRLSPEAITAMVPEHLGGRSS